MPRATVATPSVKTTSDLDELITWAQANDFRGRTSKYRVEIEHFVASGEKFHIHNFTSIDNKGRTPSKQASSAIPSLMNTIAAMSLKGTVRAIKRGTGYALINMSALSDDEKAKLDAEVFKGR